MNDLDAQAAALTEAIMSPIQDVGRLLATHIEKLETRLSLLEERFDDYEAAGIANAEGRRP